MNEQEVNRLDHFIKQLNDNLEGNLPKVVFQFLNEYDSPEFDPLRDEIVKCLLCDFCQAAITLTNHLTENFLKTMLVYRESLDSNRNEDLTTQFSKGLDTYDDMNLFDTINQSVKHKIIKEEQGITLQKFRQDFRNAYSHATKRKIFKNSTIRTQKVAMTEQLEYKLEEPKESLASNLVFAQGIIQAELSKKIAFEYFIAIDKIIRESLEQFYGANASKQDKE